MPLILVVEQDEGVVSHLRRTFEDEEGWRVRHVRGVDEAMHSLASAAPDLIVASTAISSVGSLLGPFARRQGGPGTLALIPEESAPPPDGLAEAGYGADAALARPVSSEQILRAVRNILQLAEKPAPRPETDEPKLTSRDIFGDLVAEVEREERERESRTAAEPEPSGGESPRAEASAPAEPEAPSRPAADRPTKPRPTRPRPRPDDDIERRLEQTLSGVLSPGTWRAPKTAEKGSEPPGDLSNKPPARDRPEERDASSEIDDLLDRTLSGLDLPRRKKKKPAAPKPSIETKDTDAQPPSEPPPSPPDVAEPRPSPGPSWTLESEPEASPEEPAEVETGAETGTDSDAGQPVPKSTGPPPTRSVTDRLEEMFGPLAPPAGDSAAGRNASGETAEPAGPPEPSGPPSVPFEPELADALEEAPEAAAPDRAGTPPPASSDEGGRGTAFGQYRLLERIGLGGMAEVWKARMTGVEGFQKTVAIKKILAHLTDSSDFVEMFIDEAKLAAQLNHANIIHIYDLGKIEGDYYIAMEYVEGENLRAILNAAREEGRPLPVGLALFIAAKLASALDYAHRKRDFEDQSLELVHRDVSPQNVLVGYEGTIKLCDFGIVKAVSKSSHTRMGALKGKLQYMSPEQAWGREVDSRSDIFSLGSLLFEMLTGRRLFTGDSEMEVLESVRECRVQAPGDLDPGVPREVDAVVLKALARDPAERYQEAGEMGRRLEEILVSMRPSPGPAELSAYMRELFDRTEMVPPTPETPGAPAEPPAPSRWDAERVHIDESVPELPEVPPPGDDATATGEEQEEDEAPAEEAPGLGGSPEQPSAPEEPPEPSSAGLVDVLGGGEAAPPADEPPPGDEARAPSASAAPAGGSEQAAEELEAEPVDRDREPTLEQPTGAAVEAVEPVAEVDLEEGGKRGRGLLIVAILAALAAAALLYWFVWMPRTAEPEPVPAPDGPSQEAPADRPSDAVEPDASEAGGAAPDAADGEAEDPEEAAGAVPGAGRAATDDAAEGPAGGAPATAAAEPAAGRDVRTMVEQTLEEKLAQEESQLRQEYEQKQRELAERLAAAERRALETPSPPAEPAPEANAEASPDQGSEEKTPARSQGAADLETPARPDRSGGSPATGEAADSGGAGAPAESVDARGATGGDRAARATATPSGAGDSESSPEDEASAARRQPAPEPEPKKEPKPEPEPTVRVGELVRPGPGVVPPQLVTFEKPEYPPVARRLRAEGTVIVSVLVDENGDVIDTRLDQRVRQKVGINEAALEAARRATYRPATKDGVRVKMWTTLKIPFRL